MEKKYLDYDGLKIVFEIINEKDKRLETDVTEILNGMSQKIADLEELIYTFHPKPIIEIPTISAQGVDFDVTNENVTELIINVESEVDITTLELNWSGVDWSKEGNLTNSWDIINPKENEKKLKEFGIDNLGVSTTSYTLTLTSLLDTLPKIVDDEENVGISIIATNEAGTESKSINIKVEKEEEEEEQPTIPDDKKLEIVGNGYVMYNANYPQYAGVYEINDQIYNITVSGDFEKLHLPNCASTCEIRFNGDVMVKEFRVGTGIFNVINNGTFHQSLQKLTLDGTTFNLTSTTNPMGNQSITLTFANTITELKANNLTFNGKGGGMMGRVTQTVDVSVITDFDVLLPFINAEVTKEANVSGMNLKVNASLYNQAVEANSSNGGKWTNIQSA